MTVSTTDQNQLAVNLCQNILIYLGAQGSAPGANQLPMMLAFAGVTYAEGVLTLGGAVEKFMPTANSPGDRSGFITQIFENALGRVPSNEDISYYQNVIASTPDPEGLLTGWALVLFYVSTSPESAQRNAGVGIVF